MNNTDMTTVVRKKTTIEKIIDAINASFRKNRVKKVIQAEDIISEYVCEMIQNHYLSSPYDKELLIDKYVEIEANLLKAAIKARLNK